MKKEERQGGKKWEREIDGSAQQAKKMSEEQRNYTRRGRHSKQTTRKPTQTSRVIDRGRKRERQNNKNRQREGDTSSVAHKGGTLPGKAQLLKHGLTRGWTHSSPLSSLLFESI